MEKKDIKALVREQPDATLAEAAREIERWANECSLSDGVLRRLVKESEPYSGCDAGEMFHIAEIAVHREIARRFALGEHRQEGVEMLVVLESETATEAILQVKNWNAGFSSTFERVIEKWHETDDEYYAFVLRHLKKAGYEVSTVDFRPLYAGD